MKMNLISILLQVLDQLITMENKNDTSLRNKRTIGILRQLFPTISKVIIHIIFTY